jgi:tRNA(fMet)-specific endonuclease VapC
VTPRYLLDTNAISERARTRPNAGLVAQMERHERELATAAPVWHELIFGMHLLPASRRRSHLEAYLRDVIYATLPILPYDGAAAEWHGEERARLSRLGQPAPFVDGQIASIAVTNDLVLVTTNGQAFRGFRGLRVVNWRT